MCTPHVTEYADGKERRKAAQKPIQGYFPAIVDEDTFQRARSLLLDTPSPLRGRNAYGVVKNLFGGLTRLLPSTMDEGEVGPGERVG